MASAIKVVVFIIVNWREICSISRLIIDLFHDIEKKMGIPDDRLKTMVSSHIKMSVVKLHSDLTRGD